MGWKKRTTNTSDGRKMEFFLLPDGSNLNGRVNALHHMVENGYLQNDVEKMRESLRLEGWRQHYTLPENWLQNKSSAGHDIRIVSPSGQLFRSMTAVTQYMESKKIEEKNLKTQSVKREPEGNLKSQSVKREAEEDSDLEEIRKKMRLNHFNKTIL